MRRSDFDAAVEALAPAQTIARARPRLALAYGRALFGARRYQDAAAAFQRAIDLRFNSEPVPLRPVATIWLARAKTSLADTAAARRAYQDAFADWKDADQDLPILVAARKEYAALR
jgi:tetratricopeptide (TPR) repeat protein